MSVIEMIRFAKSDDLPPSHDFEKLSDQAAVVDKNISGAGIVGRLEETLLLKTIGQKANKLGRLSPEVISLQIQLIICYLKKGDLDNVYKYLRKITKIIFVDEKSNTPPSIYFKEITDLAAAIDKHTSDKVVVNNPRYLYLIDMLSFLYFQIACMYQDGSGIEQDYKEFFKWCRKSAEMGFFIAQSELGDLYREGKEIVQDYKEAFKWYRMAAEEGDAWAQVELGYLYRDGHGIEQNDHEAVKWYLRATEQGDESVVVNLGGHYAAGEGVEKDNIQAYKWFSVAVINGDEDSQKYKQRLEEEMTPIQVAEAQELARKWIEKWKRKPKPI